MKWGWKGGERSLEVCERPFCTPEGHYKEYCACPFDRRKGWIYNKDQNTYRLLSPEDTVCGWHGLSYSHCMLCGCPLDGVPIGTKDGKWVYRPFTLADKINFIMKGFKPL